MKLTLKRKLTISLLATILMVIFIIIGIQMIMKSYRMTSGKLILEYHESSVLHGLLLSLEKIHIQATQTDTIISNQNYILLKNSINEAKISLQQCKNLISDYHKKSNLELVDSLIVTLENNLKSLNEKGNLPVYFANIFTSVEKGINLIEELSKEVVHEIEEYERKSKTAIIHGRFTVLSLGILLILTMIIIGRIFIRSITKPIDKLLSTTKQIAEGDHNSRVRINSDDEFQSLASSFNTMLDILEDTTVSKQYINNIINNMFDLLMVTDKSGKITIVNKAASRMLNYQQDYLIGKDVRLLFNEIFNKEEGENPFTDLNIYSKIMNEKGHFVRRDNKSIPVLVSCIQLFIENSEEPEGLIIVAHDLTETRELENEIELTRVQGVLAINEAQEMEKMRIASDLHDGLGQMLTAISYSLQNISNHPGPSQKEIQSLIKLINSAIQESKNIAHNLMPMALKDFGLIVALQNLIDRSNELGATFFHFSTYDFNERLDKMLEKAIYRVCQEAICNIQKHAQAQNASLQILKTTDLITIVIEDNGIGFNPDSFDKNGNTNGLGLVSMKERITLFGGNFTLNSAPGKGTEIIIEIPDHKKSIK